MDFFGKKGLVYSNPENLPLNELTLSSKNFASSDDNESKPTKYPALHKVFVDQRLFHLYQPYTECAHDDINSIKSYITTNVTYIENLNILLACNYHNFWCYLTQSSDAVKMIKSFLYRFTPVCDVDAMEPKCLKLYKEIHKKVCTILVRIVSSDCSPSEHMEQSVAFKLLREAQLFTFPIFLNILAVYDQHCAALVADITRLYFDEVDPAEWQRELDQFINQAITSVEMAGSHVCGIDSLKRSESARTYQQVASYAHDILYSVHVLLARSVYLRERAYELNLPLRLTYFHNEVYAFIANRTKGMCVDWTEIKATIMRRVDAGRELCLQMFHVFVAAMIDAIMTNHGNVVEQERNAEKYMRLMSITLEDELFIMDYHRAQPIDEQVELIKDYYPDVDSVRLDYLLICLEGLIKAADDASSSSPSQSPFSVKQPPARVTPTPPTIKTADTNGKRSDDDIEEMIRMVMDQVPGIGDAYALHCLEYHAYDPIATMTSILNDTLPPSARTVPRDAIRIPPDADETASTLQVHVAKSAQPVDAKRVLDDPVERREMRDFILSRTQPTWDDDDFDDEPESVPSRRRDLLEESDPYKYMDNRFDSYDNDEEEDEEAEADEGQVGKEGAALASGFRAFCQDPAKMREQRELARRNFRGRGDVVGRPRGRGQDQSVQRNRDRKTEHKSSRANHNRKGAAAWKRGRGMF